MLLKLLIVFNLLLHVFSQDSVNVTDNLKATEVNPSNYDANRLTIFSHPLRNLVIRSFEGYRKLIRNSNPIEEAIRQNFRLPNLFKIRRLDPLSLPEPITVEHRDPKTPVLGKVKITLENVEVAGLSGFKVDSVDGFGRNLFFEHRIPMLDTVANYTVDYHLFDEIPLRLSTGKLKAETPNARIKGSFQIFPDLLNAWFRVAELNVTAWVEDIDLKVYPDFIISDRFVIERTTIFEDVEFVKKAILSSFEKWRALMINGNNEIPILDPFRLPLTYRFIYREVTTTVIGYYHIILSNATFYGLSTFTTKRSNYNAIKRQVEFVNSVENVTIRSDYKVTFVLLDTMPLPLSEGIVSATINSTQVNGTFIVIPNSNNWFKVLDVIMKVKFERFTFHIQPKSVGNKI
ncbi:hypothetical protein B4U79_13407, partial [Dinothrombium tinctorium]